MKKQAGGFLKRLAAVFLAAVMAVAFAVPMRAEAAAFSEEVLPGDGVREVLFAFGGSIFAIMNDGTLWAWGANSLGQLGDGTTTDRHSPVLILEDVASIIASWGTVFYAGSVFAIQNDGTLWAWGQNMGGELGDGTRTDRHSPVRTLEDVASITSNGSRVFAIQNDGTLWAWGFGHLGDGDGTTTVRHSPVRILEDVVSIASPGGGGVFAIQSDGALWNWARTPRMPLPVRILEDVDVASITTETTRYGVPLAIQSDGTLWTWDSERNPIRIMLEDVASVTFVSALGLDSIPGSSLILATQNDGTLWDVTPFIGRVSNSMENRDGVFVAVQYRMLEPLRMLEDIASFSLRPNGPNFALRSDGTLWDLGDDSLQNHPRREGLGGDDAIQVMENVAFFNIEQWRIPGIRNAQDELVEPERRGYVRFAVRSDGTLWAWGDNEFGLVGDGTTTDRPSPVQIMFPSGG